MKYYLEEFNFPIFDYEYMEETPDGSVYYGVTRFLTYKNHKTNTVNITDGVVTLFRNERQVYSFNANDLTEWKILTERGDSKNVCGLVSGYPLFTYARYEYSDGKGYYFDARPIVNYIPYYEECETTVIYQDKGLIFDYETHTVALIDAQLLAKYNSLMPLDTLWTRELLLSDSDVAVLGYDTLTAMSDEYDYLHNVKFNLKNYTQDPIETVGFNRITGELIILDSDGNVSNRLNINSISKNSLIIKNPRKTFYIYNEPVFVYNSIEKSHEDNVVIYNDVVWLDEDLRVTNGGDLHLNHATGHLKVINLLNESEAGVVYEGNLYTDQDTFTKIDYYHQYPSL